MNIKPNPKTVLLQLITNDKKLPSGLELPEGYNTNTTQYKVIAIGQDFDKHFDLTTNSKVIITGGATIKYKDVDYVVSKEEQIVCVINK